MKPENYLRFALIAVAACILIELFLQPIAHCVTALTGAVPPVGATLTTHDVIFLVLALVSALSFPRWLTALTDKPVMGFARGAWLSAPFLAVVWLVTLAVEGSAPFFGRLDSGAFWLLCFGAAFYVALAEELLLRGALQTFLERRVKVRTTVWLQGLAFMLLHIPGHELNLFQAGFYLAAGVLLTVAFLRWRSIWTVIGIHFVWDVSAFALQGFPFRHVVIAGLVDTQKSSVSFLFFVVIIAALIILLTREETQEALELRAPLDDNDKGKVTVP